MKAFTYLYGLFFLSFLSCEKRTVVPINVDTKTVSSITIKLDTEDHLYKFNDNWYRWAEDYSSCAPDFYAEYEINSLTDAKLIIKHCASSGSISMESLNINSSDCNTSSIGFTQHEEEDLLKTVITVSPEFNYCMLENSGVVSLSFDFFE